MYRIRELRKQKGYKQAELAALIGADSTLISRWERGKATPSSYYIIKLSQVLEVSMDYLMEEVDTHKQERVRAASVPQKQCIIQENQSELVSSSPQTSTLGLDYWGAVVENARKVAVSGKDLDLILHMLREACKAIETAQVKDKIQIEDTQSSNLKSEELAVVGL